MYYSKLLAAIVIWKNVLDQTLYAHEKLQCSDQHTAQASSNQ
jgi:hypothetical protein